MGWITCAYCLKNFHTSDEHGECIGCDDWYCKNCDEEGEWKYKSFEYNYCQYKHCIYDKTRYSDKFIAEHEAAQSAFLKDGGTQEMDDYPCICTEEIKWTRKEAETDFTLCRNCCGVGKIQEELCNKRLLEFLVGENTRDQLVNLMRNTEPSPKKARGKDKE